MLTPRVTETTRRYAENAECAEEQAELHPAPRREPYNRAAERAMVRASLLAVEMHTHAYDRERP